MCPSKPNAIWPPLGAHAGEVGGRPPRFTRTGACRFAAAVGISTTYSSESGLVAGSPPVERTNAICRPSGDQVGSRSSAEPEVTGTRIGAPHCAGGDHGNPGTGWTKMCGPPSEQVSHSPAAPIAENARNVPSGDHVMREL